MLRYNLRIIMIVLTAAFSIVLSDDCCAQYEKIKGGEFGIETLYPVSYSEVGGSVWMDVNNPYSGLTVSEVTCVVYRENQPFIEGVADPFIVPAGESRVVISGKAALCEGVTLIEVLKLVLVLDLDLYTVDMVMTVTDASGNSKVLKQKGRPVTELLKITKR